MPTIQVATESGTLALHTLSILAIRVAHFNGGIARSPDTSCEALAPRAYSATPGPSRKILLALVVQAAGLEWEPDFLKTTSVEQAK